MYKGRDQDRIPSNGGKNLLLGGRKSREFPKRSPKGRGPPRIPNGEDMPRFARAVEKPRPQKGDIREERRDGKGDIRRPKSSPSRKANECVMVEEFRRQRKKLQKFASNPTSLDDARKNFPYHRDTAANFSQLQYINQLRERYVAMTHDLNHELIVRRYRLPKEFVFDTHGMHFPVDLMPGTYHPDEVNQVIFANSNVGGGYLTYGMAQEEVTCCERTDWAMLIAEMYARGTPLTIASDEALVISGADLCAGIDFYGRVPQNWNERCCYFSTPHVASDLIAIDCIRAKWKKYSLANLKKCVMKAYCGFQGATADVITTGPWGCGAFFNNYNVMFCVQALAAWLAGKKLCYHSVYPRVARGYDMVKRWCTSKMQFRLCFAELLARCQSDPEFETSYDPSLTTDKFTECKMTNNLAHIRDVVSSNSLPDDDDDSETWERPVKRMLVVDFNRYVEKKWGADPPQPLLSPSLAPASSAPNAADFSPKAASPSPKAASSSSKGAGPSPKAASSSPKGACSSPKAAGFSPKAANYPSRKRPSFRGGRFPSGSSPQKDANERDSTDNTGTECHEHYGTGASAREKNGLAHQQRLLNELVKLSGETSARGENPQNGVAHDGKMDGRFAPGRRGKGPK